MHEELLHCYVFSHSTNDPTAPNSLLYINNMDLHRASENDNHGRLWSRISQFSHSVVSNALRPHELQHTTPACLSPTPGVHSDSWPSSQWCHPAISSSVVPYFFCPRSLPASESFPMSQLFAWGGQSAGVSALASFLPKKSQGWSPSEWTGWISLQSKGLSYIYTMQVHV